LPTSQKRGSRSCELLSELVGVRGTNGTDHYNGIKTWYVHRDGKVSHEWIAIFLVATTVLGLAVTISADEAIPQ
jgi:hypothetical protein